MFLGFSFLIFFSNLRELVPPLVASIMGEFEQTLWWHFENIFGKESFKGQKNTVNKYAIDIIG